MRAKAKVAALGGALVLAASACASDPGKANRANLSRFELLDLDKDGSLSVTEALAVPGLASRFGSADRDGDGKLSRSEFLQYLSPQSSSGGR